MDFWILFWTLIILFGIGSFIVLVVAVIPLGGKDVWELLRRLGSNNGSDEPSSRTRRRP